LQLLLLLIIIPDRDRRAAATAAAADISSFLAGRTETTACPLCSNMKSVDGNCLISSVKLFGKNSDDGDDDRTFDEAVCKNGIAFSEFISPQLT
jgi:hypothetical protein